MQAIQKIASFTYNFSVSSSISLTCNVAHHVFGVSLIILYEYQVVTTYLSIELVVIGDMVLC